METDWGVCGSGAPAPAEQRPAGEGFRVGGRKKQLPVAVCRGRAMRFASTRTKAPSFQQRAFMLPCGLG